MNGMMEYKGYVGSAEFSAEDGVFFGKVQGVGTLISYEGTSVDQLTEDFHSAVDDYLDVCAAEGKKPEKGYRGTFNIHISPELHRKAAIAALSEQITLNRFVERSIEQAVNR